MTEDGASHDGAMTTQDKRDPRVTFVLERHVGLRTYAENLNVMLNDVDGVDTSWVWVDYAVSGGWWERLPLDSLRAMLRGRVEVASGFRSERPDVAVCNTQVPMVIGPRSSRQAPYVVCTDVTPIQYDEMAEGYGHRRDENRIVRAVKHRRNVSVLRGAAAHAPWSHWAARSLVDDYGVDASKIEVIPPGVDIDSLTPVATSSDIARILFVGGDFERKGGPLLLEAFTHLEPGAAHLDVVTRQPVEAPDGVTVHNGLRPNDGPLVDLFRKADIFVLPSRYETFGISAVEAAASGAALVVSSTGGLEELVVDGETGFQLRDDSTAELGALLRRLVDDIALRERFGNEARRRAVANFNGETNARRLLDLALTCVVR